jgi:DNA-binding MarR family transcriptional regulator
MGDGHSTGVTLAFIERVPNAEDGRSLLVRLTQLGKDVVEKDRSASR